MNEAVLEPPAPGPAGESAAGPADGDAPAWARPLPPGFRLARCELFNWGTFHGAVWSLDLGDDSALITGEIGSGKSTYVDALTTLLVPPQRIVYNRAAGAEKRERTLLTYIRGHYKSEKDDRLAARAVGLRGAESYSVVLARFEHAGLKETLTLAQMFWCKEGDTAPERLYVVADQPLAIASDFADFGGDLATLKKRLKRQGVRLHASFAEYSRDFRRRLGLPGEQALELFYQTVSLKRVDNITDFVRTHMLEAPPVRERIDAICRDFDNLNAAHEVVVKARRQIELLRPLIADCDRLAAVHEAAAGLERQREGLAGFLAGHKIAALDREIADAERQLLRIQAAATAKQNEIGSLYERQGDLKRQLLDAGGRRLDEIDAAIRMAETDKAQRRGHFDRYYVPAAERLGLTKAESLHTFHANAEKAARLAAGIDLAAKALAERREELTLAIGHVRQQGLLLEAEIRSLTGQRSNIPGPMRDLRARLAETLGIPPQELPFAGELIQVKAGEAHWEGAVERLLRGFALSLLVDERHAAAVAQWVDRTHLDGRLVWFRVKPPDERRPLPRRHADLLIHKLDLAPEHPFRDWLHDELAQHFDYVCCADLPAFHREARAITAAGQVKSRGIRHEKDDRRRLTDRTQYVLGWQVEAKLAALEAELTGVTAELQALAGRNRSLKAEETAHRETDLALRELLKVEAFDQIDWQTPTRRIHQLQAERRELEESSDLLATLRAQLAATETEVAEAQRRKAALDQDIGKRQNERSAKKEQRASAEKILAGWPEADRPLVLPALEARLAELPLPRTALQWDEIEPALRKPLRAEIEARSREAASLSTRVTQQMNDYRRHYPDETREADASPEAAGEYRQMLARLEAEDLPRFEARFKAMLNERTINDIALLASQLDAEAEEIRAKVARINTSLRAIPYGDHSYIQLAADPAPVEAIVRFREDLRACLSQTLAGAAGPDDDALYTEQKFLQVKAIIDRFNGRPGLTELDRSWTEQVTDVRQWFRFSGSERSADDDREIEFYSDTSGKSGGQKEKLAYTILAAALAYQYGLDATPAQDKAARRQRVFRFVAIDEAFGRGSDTSARYALRLFRELGLQLLIVTPLAKIHVIEDYVGSVHFVYNRDGTTSQLRSLSLSDYQAEKAQRAGREIPPTAAAGQHS